MVDSMKEIDALQSHCIKYCHRKKKLEVYMFSLSINMMGLCPQSASLSTFPIFYILLTLIRWAGTIHISRWLCWRGNKVRCMHFERKCMAFLLDKCDTTKSFYAPKQWRNLAVGALHWFVISEGFEWFSFVLILAFVRLANLYNGLHKLLNVPQLGCQA